MAALTQKRKAELAQDIRVLASWLGGPREVKALAIAAELEGADPEEAAEQATKEVAKASAPTKLKAEAKPETDEK